MAEEQSTGAPAGTERPITFQGREIWVRFPSGEQLTVWQRTLQMLQRADTDGWDGEKVMNAYSRLRRIIDSIILNKIDKDWLDDEWLDGRLDMVQSAQIIQLTLEAFSTDDNRAAKRAATKKATRRKVSN
jgi:hypothetical protein